MTIHFRIKENLPLPAPMGGIQHIWSFQAELETPGGLQWFTLAKNRNLNALLAIASMNKLAVEIVRAEP